MFRKLTLGVCIIFAASSLYAANKEQKRLENAGTDEDRLGAERPAPDGSDHKQRHRSNGPPIRRPPGGAGRRRGCRRWLRRLVWERTGNHVPMMRGASLRKDDEGLRRR